MLRHAHHRTVVLAHTGVTAMEQLCRGNVRVVQRDRRNAVIEVVRGAGMLAEIEAVADPALGDAR